MTLLALWYHHSPEGQRFLAAREIRSMLALAGIVAAYVLLRSRQPFSHQESRWWTAWRLIIGGVVAAVLWLSVDLVRGEDWIVQLLAALPELHENGIRYSVLILAGWLGWSIAIFELLRRITIRRQRYLAEPGIVPQRDCLGRASSTAR
jgi:hypothetical protein